MKDRVAIVGAGLSGLAAAAGLARHGCRVTILESRGRAGGRASSFTDSATGRLVDTCQHVSMGCCTNLAHFCTLVGIDHFIEPQRQLFFLTPEGRVSRFRADPLPAPLHLARSFLGLHYLSLREKLSIARCLWRLRALPEDVEGSFIDWLSRNRQTPAAIERFWGLVLTSCLNEEVERVGIRYARKVFVDGFLRHRRGFVVSLPTVPLGRLYGEELQDWLKARGVQVVLNCGVARVLEAADRVTGLELRDGTRLEADWYVTAVPFERLADLLPAAWTDDLSALSPVKNLETSPIVSVHLWYDRPITQLPHVVLVGCQGQWLFNRGQVAAGEHYFQVVISAARRLRGAGHEEVQQRIVAEVAKLFPEAAVASLVRARVVTEHAATFSAVPGIDRFRPGQETPIDNLFLAGDWTATGWPATMEGAVRSGYLAAEAILQRIGKPARLIQPDL
jgi:squalene-associated FAD-dependent desaturase